MAANETPTEIDALMEIAHALNRIAQALEKGRASSAPQSKPAPGSKPPPTACEKCGAGLEVFTARDGKKYRRCVESQRLYRAGTPEEGHHFSMVGQS
jgi:hypothetical protein